MGVADDHAALPGIGHLTSKNLGTIKGTTQTNGKVHLPLNHREILQSRKIYFSITFNLWITCRIVYENIDRFKTSQYRITCVDY